MPPDHRPKPLRLQCRPHRSGPNREGCSSPEPLPSGVKDPNQMLTEQGPSALREAVSHREAFPGLSAPVPLLTPAVEEEPETTVLRRTWEGLAVALTPHPPFRSRLRATLRVDQGALSYRHTFELSAYRARSQAAGDLARRFSLEAETTIPGQVWGERP